MSRIAADFSGDSSDIRLVLDDGPNQEEGAIGGGPVRAPDTAVGGRTTVPSAPTAVSGPTTSTTAAPALSLAPYLSSSRGGGGGEGQNRDLSGRRPLDQREQDESHRRIAQQDALMLEFQRRLQEQQDAMMVAFQRLLREMDGERSREVRESPEEDHDSTARHRTHTRASDRSEVSGRYLNPGQGEPVTSTPLRPVGFDLGDGRSPADLTARPAVSTSVGYPGNLVLEATPGGRLDASATRDLTGADPGGRSSANVTMNLPVADPGGRSSANVTMNLPVADPGGRSSANVTMNLPVADPGGRSSANVTMNLPVADPGGRSSANVTMNLPGADPGGRLDASATMNPSGASLGGGLDARAHMNPSGASLGGGLDARVHMNPSGASLGGGLDARVHMNPSGASLGGGLDARAHMNPSGASLGGRLDARVHMNPSGASLGGYPDARATIGPAGVVPPDASGNVTFSDFGFQPVGGGGGQRGPLVRVGEYDGESDLTAFLSRFERMAQFYRWSEHEQLVYLETSLKGPAADIVYDVESTTTIQEVKDMLRLRFGTEKQGELSRIELQLTRRQSGEPLQRLYGTIKKLVALGYPGPLPAEGNWLARDHFLRALDDDVLRVQVSMRKPATLEEALTAAMELEALGVGVQGERLRKESQTRTGSSQRDWTRSQRTSRPGLDRQVERTLSALPRRDVETLIRAIHSWTELMVDEPPSPTDTGQDCSCDSDYSW